MFENILKFFKKSKIEEKTSNTKSKSAAKERLHLVLMQDRANVSADFLDLMKQEIIDVIKKYIEVDESAIDVRLTNKENEDGTNGAPALYANIPILNIKNEARKVDNKENKKEENQDNDDNNKKENEVIEQENKEIEEINNEEANVEENQENSESNNETESVIIEDNAEETTSETESNT